MAATLVFNSPPRRGSPGTISVTFLPKGHGCQGTKWRRNIAENFNRLSRAHERYRRQTDDRQTDGRTTTYSEREPTQPWKTNTRKTNGKHRENTQNTLIKGSKTSKTNSTELSQTERNKTIDESCSFRY